MEPSTGTCAKDSNCFDANYECEGCCKNGIAKNGENCWDDFYTKDKCCNSKNSPPPPISNIPSPNISDKLNHDLLSSPDLTPQHCIPNEGICSIYNKGIDKGNNPLGKRVTTDTGKCMQYISPHGWCGFTSGHKTNALADCTLCGFKETD